MKVIQRNKIKFKVFTEEELKEKLGMKEEDIQVVLEYQDKFPELLQDKGEGFCINGRKLHEQLVEDVKINKGKKVKGDKFTQWIKRRIDKYNFKENEDYICHSQNCETQRKDGQSGITVKKEYNITLEMAKQLCMIENNKVGLMCRKYFIIIEKTLRNYEEWDKVRNPQRENANKLKSELKSWAIKNHFDADYKSKVMNTKVIYNPSIARQLLHNNNKIVDIKPDKNNKMQTNFVFECTEKLLKDLSFITK